MIEIWKLQRPLATNGPVEIMAYTEDRDRTAIIPVPDNKKGHMMLDQIFGDQYKVYAMAEVRKGNLTIDAIVEEQPW